MPKKESDLGVYLISSATYKVYFSWLDFTSLLRVPKMAYLTKHSKTCMCSEPNKFFKQERSQKKNN